MTHDAADRHPTDRHRSVTRDGVDIAFDVRDGGSAAPPLVCAGSPMDATGFATLAGHFTDRTVITYDRRGTGRSPVADPDAPLTPELHADDLAAVVAAAVGEHPVDVFGSSGGACNALALVARHPHRVRTLVAHEPPVPTALPDAEQVLALMGDLFATYQRLGQGPAMAKFIAFVMRSGPLPPTWAEEPAPDPSAFGLPTHDDGRRDDPLLCAGNEPLIRFEPDYDAVQAAPTRVVVAAGVEALQAMPARAAAAVAERLGRPLTLFPSHHGGFLGGEFGQRGAPAEFAARLREVLDTGAD